jgi:GGDEF domain-containing protein
VFHERIRDRTLQESHQLMERIHHGVGRALGTGLSIGIAGFQAGDSSQQLIHRADSALYQAKRAGRNRIALCADDSLKQRVFHP